MYQYYRVTYLDGAKRRTTTRYTETPKKAERALLKENPLAVIVSVRAVNK